MYGLYFTKIHEKLLVAMHFIKLFKKKISTIYLFKMKDYFLEL